uniref:Uncharacterized protein n=1 Tax=Anguilla anguilla TaxID=7936 RepID=A0A0E9TGA7_ANGAN
MVEVRILGGKYGPRLQDIFFPLWATREEVE